MQEVTAGDLGAAKVLRVAGYAYRRWFWRITLTAAVVFGAAAVIAGSVDLAIEYARHVAPAAVDTLLFVYVVVGRFAGVFALVFYAGFLDLYVGDALYAGRPMTLGSVLRRLPYTRLIAADVILAVGVELGWLLFVLPGVLLFTLFALVGPLIVVEERGLRSAFRRSRVLVARRFWLVVAVVTLPAFGEGFLEHAIHALFGLDYFVAWVLVAALFGSVVGAFVGLMEVIITRELRLLHPSAREVTPSDQAPAA